MQSDWTKLSDDLSITARLQGWSREEHSGRDAMRQDVSILKSALVVRAGNGQVQAGNEKRPGSRGLFSTIRERSWASAGPA
jgi:hypothetical protein